VNEEETMGKPEGSLLGGVLGLSMDERARFFVEWMMSETDKKLKKTFFVEWMKAERTDKMFLRDMADKAAAVFVTKGFAKMDFAEIEHWIDRAVESNKGTVDQIAHSCKNHFSLKERMVPAIRKVVLRKMQNKRMREAYRSKSGKKAAGPGRGKPTAFKRLLAEDTYSLNLSLAETAETISARQAAQPHLPGLLDEPPSLDSKRRIEDYEALVAPYRSLLADVASMEVLDELLRLLYEGGDAPSVVGWPGKTSDCEYRNLREHKHFLEILQGVSLYDHTYNVLKAALDIAHEELRQRHDFLLPAVITAALGHDIGKIASLWRSCPMKKRTHESAGEVKLKEMFSPLGNEVFTKIVAEAVSLHHTLSKDDTVARIIMDADARAREYEITSADPASTIKPMTEWLDLPRLAEIVLPHINELVVKNRRAVWEAISFDGIVYCRPDYVRDVLKTLAFEKKVLDYRLLRQSFQTDNKAVLIEFSGILKDHGYLAYDIKDGYFGLRFLFQSSVPAMSQPGLYAIPVKIGLFPADPSYIEKRKRDYLKTLVSVRAIAGGK
jgi:hypothetical protein